LSHLRTGLGLLATALLGGATFLIADAWEPFGKEPVGARADRMAASPQWSDGVFTNPQPLWNDVKGSLTAMFSASPVTTPTEPIPVMTGDRSRFATPPATGLRITWLGHSTQLIEIDGVTVLSDPIFGGRASPFTWAGPEVWYAPPIPLTELPPLDAVVISHDHYDHLQIETIQALATLDTRFIVPLGVGAHLAYWGVPEARITEVDWWDRVSLGAVEIVATPARHASGRHLLDQNRTLWAGYALVGPEHRVYFSGDTGLFPDLDTIGERLGPFDVTMIEVGAYNQAWPDWHMGPEQAVRANMMARGALLMPVHWGLWSLASHGWTEPVERVLVEAQARDVATFVPRPGQSIEPGALPEQEQWWPDIPWKTAAEDPIVATGIEPG
jgi:L-ascorbate metabolism protein UlaG (beta-lactamase superfamily)